MGTGGRARTRRVLIQRRRFVTAKFRRPNPHISLPLYCVRPRSGSGHACHTQMYNSFFKSSFPARSKTKPATDFDPIAMPMIDRDKSKFFRDILALQSCVCTLMLRMREICVRQVNLDITSLN